MKPTNGLFIFESTGRTFRANCDIIGLAPDLQVYDGFDGTPFIDANTYVQTFTPEERRELADYMIALWMRFREQAS